MYSGIRVKAMTRDGPIDLSDVVVSLAHTDSMDGTPPQCTINLPLYRTTTPTKRVPYLELLHPGALVTVEALGTYAGGGKWVTLTQGLIGPRSQRQIWDGEKSDTGTTFVIRDAAQRLHTDGVAYWMWLGTEVGVQKTRAFLTSDELNAEPHRIVMSFLTKVLDGVSAIGLSGHPLGEYLGVTTSGLKAIAPMEYGLATVEGSFWDIIKRLEDAPLHEMYSLCLPQASLSGDLIRKAKRTVGDDGAASTAVMRRAPYPYMDENGKGMLHDWNALPLHVLDGDLSVTQPQNISANDDGVRNFVLLYPAFQFTDEMLAYASGYAYLNRESMKTFGYMPAKWSTNLILTAPKDTLESFTRRLSARAAGQYNHMEHALQGTLNIPFAPHIRPGERVRTAQPWGGPTPYQFHVRGRTLTWTATTSGTMQLQVERGHPEANYQDAAYWAQGLEPVNINWHTYATEFSQQLTPGK